jgi:hypothetical protein
VQAAVERVPQQRLVLAQVADAVSDDLGFGV